MHSVLEREPVVSSAVSQPTTLKAVLEQLDIIPFTAESVASYKRKRMAAVMEEIKNRAGLIEEMIPAYWERQVLCRLKPDDAFHSHDDDISVVKFFDLGAARLAVYVHWEKKPLAKALGVPEYVRAKAVEIANSLPTATFEVDELSSLNRVYDPFLVVSYGEEVYYVEVWDEPVFERQHN